MKRSKQVQLVLLSAVPFALVACGGGQQPVRQVKESRSFESMQACVDGKVPADICADSYMAALQQHKQVAPVYSDKQACETDFIADYCVPTSAGQFMPKMGGFELIVEREEALNPDGTPVTPASAHSSGGGSGFLTGLLLGNALSGSGPRYYSEPIYMNRDSRGRFQRTSLRQQINTGKTFSSSQQAKYGGGFKPGSGSTKPMSVASTTSRGGFGSQSSARSGWGSGFGG